jgi:hypothetical protein
MTSVPAQKVTVTPERAGPSRNCFPATCMLPLAGGVMPPKSAFTHHRDGCADLFYLPEPDCPGQGTMFEVSRNANGSVGVRAEVRNQAA